MPMWFANDYGSFYTLLLKNGVIRYKIKSIEEDLFGDTDISRSNLHDVIKKMIEKRGQLILNVRKTYIDAIFESDLKKMI